MMDTLGLTRREIEVLQAKINHGTNENTAAAMGIAYGTLKNHLHAINRKLKTETVTQAVVLAWFKRLVW